MSFYHQEDCEGWPWQDGIKFEPSEPEKVTDPFGFTYINKLNELEDKKNEYRRVD